jgi:fibronectin-binding autotransporter adhesin
MKTPVKKTNVNLFCALAAVTLLALSIPSASAAGTDTWVGNTDANWNTAANWTTSGGSTPPGTGDSLIFGAAGSAGTSLNNDIFGLSVFNFNINSGASAFTFGGNGITLNGTLTDAAGVNETFGGGVTIGSSVATAIKNTGSGTLALGALSAGIGGTVDFTITGPITTTIANTSGILGGWATTGNNVSSATTGDWVANDGSGNIIAYTGYTVGTVIAGQLATANFKNTANATMTASTTINSLSQWADVTLSSGQTLTVNSGGLILGGISRWMKNGGTGGNALGGNEFLKSGLATGELYVHVPDADAAANNWTIWPIVADNLAATTLIKDGPGLVKLGNYNTYTGGTFVNGGTLQLGNASGGGGTGFLRGVVTVNSGATLNLSRVDAVGYNAGVCVDTLNVVGGTVANTSGGNEGFLMNINLTGGTVTSTGGKYVFSGGYGINSLASPLTSLISAPLNIQGASTIAVAQGNTASGNDLVLSGVISGVGSVTKTGAGKMIMSGANTYTGDTYISEGVLQLGDGTSASGSLAGNIDNETTLIIANPGAVTIPGVIYSSSAAPVIKTGAGTLTLSGANTYSGPTTVSNGVVLFAAPQSLTGSVTVLDGAGIGVMATTDEVYYSPSSLTLGGTTGAKLQFGVFGTTTAVLNPATLTINGTATINISSAPFVIGASYPLVANYTGGTLALGTQPPGYYGQLTVSGTTVSYMVTNISVDVWTAAVSTNWDTTTANWTNSVGGNLFAANDLVQFDDSAAGTSPLLVNITPSAVTNYSMLVSNTAKSYIIGGLSIGGASSLTKDGNNTLTLTGTNTFTGPTTISAGTVEIGGTGQLGSGAYSAAITDNGILSINSSAAQTLSGVISGGGSLVKSNTGTLILSAANTFSGGSSISNGTVQLSNGAGLGSAAVNLNGGTLQATAAITVANDIVSGGGGTISIPATAGNDFTLAGTLSGTGPLTLGGGGPIKSLNLSFAANTLSGNITIPASPNQTVVRFKTTTAGSPTAAWAITGDTTTRFVTLDFVGTLEFGSLSGPAILSGNGAGLKTLSVGALGTDSTFSGSIRNGSGTAALTKVGAGKLTLTGASTFTAKVNINEGTLSVSNTSAISTSGTITFGGGTLQYTPANQVDYSARIANSASPILIDVNGTNVTYATALPASNTGGLALTNSIGAGVLTLTANNLFTGTTLINAGTLALSGSGNIGSSTNISVASGATFDVSGATYTLGSAQTLSGSGTVTGAVATASIGSSITPGGAGTVGALSFKNNLNMSSGASPVFDLSTSSASGNDQIVVAGALTLGSADAIHVNALSGSANLDQAADYILFSVTGTTTMSGQPVLVFDNTAPANFSHYSIKTSGNNVVLRYSASSTPVITSVVVTNTADGSTVGTRGQSVTVYVTVTPGLGTVTNVSADLSLLGGSAAQSLTPLGGNQYSYTLLLGPAVTVGLDTVNVSATDTTPLSGFGSANFTVNALTETWNGLALDDNWSSATNWVGDLPPGYVGDPVIFTGSTRTTPVVDNNYSVAGLTFDGAASSFAITNAPGKTLTLAGGVTNSSASAQALDLPIILNGTQTIEDQSSAGIALGGSVGSAVLGSGLTVNAGIVTLAGSNTYSGDTTIAVGTLKVANSAAIPSGSGKGNVILAGTLDINGTNAFINNLQGGAGVVDNTSATSASTLTLGENNDAISLTGVTVQNSGGTNLSLVKVGTGDLAMASANTFSGGLTVSNGTALLGNNNAAGSGTITLAGGTLQNSVNNLTLANNIDVTAASAMTIGSGLNWQINGNLTGSGNITYSPANFAATLALAGDNSGYSGTFTVNGANAAFQWMTASAGSANAAWVLNNTWSGGTRMRFSGAWNGTIELGSLSGNGIGLVNNNAGTVTMSVGALNTSTLFSGTMIVNAANIIALTKVGTGTLTLSGANSYTGLTTVSNGTLVITTAHLGNGDFAVNDNKALGVINNGGSQTALLNNLTLGDTAGPTKLFFTNVASTTIPVITAASAVTRNGTCNIAISNSVMNTGGVYPLVKYGSLAGAGSFVLSSVPSGVTATLTNDTSNLWIALAVSVGNGVNTSPTNITSVVNGTSLELSWPADHIGWRLQVQTNSLSTGLGTNWVDVPNTGTVSSYTNVVNPANGSVFYRMVYP